MAFIAFSTVQVYDKSDFTFVQILYICTAFILKRQERKRLGLITDHFSSRIAALSHSEKYVLYYLDNHLEKVVEMSISELSETLATSTTTIIRMCQKLGCRGFSEFKFSIGQLIKETKIINERFLIEQYQSFFSGALQAVQINDMEYIVRKIYAAPTVIVVGVGLTKPIAEYISDRLMQFGKPAIYAYESHILDLLPNALGAQDVVLFVSMSGQTQTLVHAAKKIQYTQAYRFVITNNGSSALAVLMNRTISSRVPSNIYEGYDITSRSFLMILADLLMEIYLKYMKKRK